MENISIRKIGMKKTKTKKGGSYLSKIGYVLHNILIFYFISKIFFSLSMLIQDFFVLCSKNEVCFRYPHNNTHNYSRNQQYFSIIQYAERCVMFPIDYLSDSIQHVNEQRQPFKNIKIFVKKNIIANLTSIYTIYGSIYFYKLFQTSNNYLEYFKNPFQKKIVKTITDVAQDKKIAINEVKQIFPNEPNINAVKTVADAKELLTDKIEEATKTMIANQPSSTIINQKDIEMLKSSNLTQNAEEFLKTSKPTSILDKITDSINSTNELYLQLENKTTETKTYIANFITKQKENIHQIKTDILAIGKSANSTIYEKTIGSLTQLFVLPTIDNLQDVFKNPNPEKIIKMLGTTFVLLSATYILTKMSIELYKWLFGIKMEEKKIDLSKLSTEEKEIIKSNEEKLKKMEKEVLEKVAKGQKISTSKKTLSKSKSKSKSN